MSENETAAYYDQKTKQQSLNTVPDFGHAAFASHLQAPYIFAEKNFPKPKSLSDPQKAKWYDLGCGRGWHSILPAQMGFEVVGVDLSAEQIASAKTLAVQNAVSERCQFRQGDALQLIGNKPEYQVIFMSGVLYYLPRPQSYSQLHSALRDGGLLICVETNGDNPLMNLWRKLRYGFKRDRDLQTVKGLLSRSEVKELARCFSQSQIRYFDFLTLFLAPFRLSPESQLLAAVRRVDDLILNRLGLSLWAFKYVVIAEKWQSQSSES